MNKNANEKSLAKVNNSIFVKIKLFFRNLFKINKTEDNTVIENIIEEKNNSIKENNFISNIKLPEKELNFKLQKMSKDLESGKIKEEDLCEEELQELREFYLQQIEQKKQSIEKYKNKIMKIKEQLA